MPQNYDSPQLNTLLGGTPSPSSSPAPKSTNYDSPALNSLLSGAKPTTVIPPVTATDTSKLLPESTSLFSKLVSLPGKAIQYTGNKLESLYGKNIESGLAMEGESGAEKALKPAASLVGGSSIENLPFGVGAVIQGYKDVYAHPEDYPEFTVEDVLKGIVDTSKDFIKTPIRAGANFRGIPLKFNVPILGEVTNRQFNAAERIRNGEDPAMVIADEGIGSIFDTLILTGIFNEIAGPRTQNIGKVNTVPIKIIEGATGERIIVSVAPDVLGTSGAKSFRLFDPIQQAQPISPSMLIRMIAEKDITPNANYSPELPTYFKATGQTGGNIKFEIIQIKPSVLNSLTDFFSKNTSAGFASTQRELLSSGHDFDRAIESGDMKVSKIYKSPNGTLQPHEVTHTVSDLAGKLNDYKVGLGEQFKKIVDTNNPTPTNLIQQASNFLTKTADSGTGINNSMKLPVLLNRQIDSIPSKEITVIGSKTVNPKDVAGAINEAPQKKELHPTLVKEVTEHVATHGEELTSLALKENLGLSAEQTANIMKTVKKSSLPVSNAEEVLHKIITPNEMGKQIPEGLPDKIQKITDKDWEENFAEAAGERFDKIAELTKQLKTAKKGEKVSIQKVLDVALKEDTKIESDFVEKWKKQIDNIPEELHSLALEAMKYKSAEEFVNSQKYSAPSRFKSGEDVLEYVDKKGAGEGAKLNQSEIRQLLSHLIEQGDTTKVYNNWGKPLERGTVYKPYGYSNDKKADVVLGEVTRTSPSGFQNKQVLVAQLNPDGTFDGRFRTHASHIEDRKIMRNIADNGLLKLTTPSKADLTDFYNNLMSSSQGGFIAPGQFTEDVKETVNIFLKEDVLPTNGRALSGLKNTMHGLLNAVVPTKGVKPADLDLVMKMKGARDKKEYIFAKTHEIIKKNFAKMNQNEQVDFIDRMKRGEKQPNEGLQAVADGLRIIDTTMWNAVKEYKPSLNWKENHFRVLWKVVPGKPEAFGFKGLFNKPLAGTKGFTKQSTLLDMSEGLAKGGVPISYNPIELFTYAYADMNKYLTAQEMIKALKEQGQMKFVKKGKFSPDGYVRLNDTISKVYIPVETAGGKTIVTPAGEWYIEDNVGRILNNFLSKDNVRSTDFGRGMLAVKNLYTAIELSLSPFHAIFESIETMGSSVGLGLQKITQGNIKSGIKDIVTSPIAPYNDARLGGDGIKYLSDPEAFSKTERGKKFLEKYPNAAELLTDLFNGGGRMKMDDTYQISTERAFRNNLKSGNYIGAALRALPALSKTLTKPLFEIYIPRLKVGTFLKEYANDIQADAKALAEGKTTREKLARERWNFVEDRFGEMNFDNLFWNKTFKTSMQLTFRSVTWKMGNLRATGGAWGGQGYEFYNAAQAKRAPRLHIKMSWFIGMSIWTAIISTTIMILFAHKKPQTVKDIVYPKVDDQGNRVSMPTYWKDAYHLLHDSTGYVRSSMTGLIGKAIDVWKNKDFYGVEIHNPNDSFFKRAEDNLIHMLPTPFSISSALSFQKTGASLDKQLMGFFGFTKAPGYVNQNEIQQKIFDVFSTRLGGGVISQEEADFKNEKDDIRKAYQNGDNAKANQLLEQAVKNGVIKDIDSFVEKADLPGDIRAFAALPSTDQRNLISKMSLDEIQKYAWYVHNDLRDSFQEISDNAEEFVNEFKAGTVIQPQYKRGVPVDDGAKPIYNTGDKTSNEGLISRVVAYAQAIGTSPIEAFDRIFHGQIIRKVNNGTIIVDRMSLAESTAIKKKGGGNNPTMKLDHTLPLELGGTNQEENLKLITTEEWASYTPIENYLNKALTKKIIDKSKAQSLIIKFKNKEITFDDIQREVKE